MSDHTAEKDAGCYSFEAEFDIQYTILRNGEEIGFGAALANSIDSALYDISTAIQRREWETSPGMPDPSEVDQ